MDLLDTQSLVSSLSECLEDTYESNQQKALNLLAKVPEDSLLSDTRMLEIFHKVFEYMFSSRTQDSMSAAYLIKAAFTSPDRSLSALQRLKTSSVDLAPFFEGIAPHACCNPGEELSLLLTHVILNVLEHQAAAAKSDLVNASQKSPMYPALLCIRYLLRDVEMLSSDRWSSVMGRLFSVTFGAVYPLVCPVVCHSSPEGYLPPDESSGDNVSARRPGLPQYLVVCCWRTIKEISLVYGTLMEKVVPNSRGIITTNQICDFIKVFYESILLNAKHRGAFEMAYTGYCSYWHTIWRLKSCQNLVAEFLNDSPYSMLLHKEAADRLCATRRSAGLPFMVQAYVTSEPKLNNNSAMDKIFNDLLPISLYVKPEKGTEMFSQVQRVHALNVLRALYKTSSLGDAVQPFVAQGLKTAVKGYKSQVWPVRNASTLLFSALITRMFGVKHGKDDLSKQSGMAGRLFFQKYPEIHPFLVEELESCTVFSDGNTTLLQPSLYLLLIVLCKLYPSQKEAADSNLSLDVFIPYLYRCASSPVYKARMLGALALANNVSYDLLTSTVTYLSDSIGIGTSHNRLHGLLLQILHLGSATLTSGHSSELDAGIFREVLVRMVKSNYKNILSSSCDLVKSTFIDIILMTKSIIYEHCSDAASDVIHTALFTKPSVKHDHPSLNSNSANARHAWSGDSVDLQLSRCRLLIDLREPVLCTGQSLTDILEDDSMYELHHEILKSASIIRDPRFISLSKLVGILQAMAILNKQVLSYSRTQSINMVCNALSTRLPTTPDIGLAVSQQIMGILTQLKTSVEPSLSVLRLEAVISTLMQSDADHVYGIVTEMLEHLRSDDMDSEGQEVCLQIIQLVSKAVLLKDDGRISHGHAEFTCNFWICCVLLVFSLDDDVRALASTVVCAIIRDNGGDVKYPSCDPHNTLSVLLSWMTSVYNREELLTMWESWQSDSRLWLPESAVDEDGTEDERLFSKAEGQLLCDPESFRRTISESCAALCSDI